MKGFNVHPPAQISAPVLHPLALLSVCALPVEHAVNHRRIDRSLDRQGKEVGGGIDKLMNDVIGRINGAPWGTMSMPACWCDRLSGEAAA